MESHDLYRPPASLTPDRNDLGWYRWFALGAFFMGTFFEGSQKARGSTVGLVLVGVLEGSAALMWCVVDALMQNEYQSRICFLGDLVLWPILWPARAIRTRGRRGALWAVLVALGAVMAAGVGRVVSG